MCKTFLTSILGEFSFCRFQPEFAPAMGCSQLQRKNLGLGGNSGDGGSDGGS